MKKIATIVLILLAFACKKKDTKPAEPEPDPVPTCQTGISYFAGDYTDQNGSKITIVFLTNNCPTQNSNTYRLDGLAAAINRIKPGAVNASAEITMSSTEYSSGEAYLNGGIGKFTKLQDSKNITFSGKVGSSTSGITLKFIKE